MDLMIASAPGGGAKRAARAGGLSAAQIHLPHALVGQELTALALVPIAAELQHVSAVRNLQGARGILLDQHDREAVVFQHPDLVEDLVHELGGKAEREIGRASC